MPEKKKEEKIETNAAEEIPIEEEKIKEVIVAPIPEEPIPAELPSEIPKTLEERALEKWVPKTKLGREVFEGKIKNIDDILKSGRRIIEPEIVDYL